MRYNRQIVEMKMTPPVALGSHKLLFMPFPTKKNWFALRTFFAQEQKVGAHLDNYLLSWFIPMRGKKGKGGRPFVHNLIFIKQPNDINVLKEALKTCPYVVFMYCNPGSRDWCVISDNDMLELRIICDQTFTEPIFLPSNEAELIAGREVRVVHGPLSGTHGRLVRKNKKYYIVKSVFNGMLVMVTVSRWCCEAV